MVVVEGYQVVGILSVVMVGAAAVLSGLGWAGPADVKFWPR